MTALSGIVTQGAYAAAPNNKARVDVLLAMLPDPDSTSSSGAVQTNTQFLDEMSPIAVATLRAELLAMKANITNA